MNHLQQNMLDILLYNTYNRLQIILKIKAQMSNWQLFYKYEAPLSKTCHCKTYSNQPLSPGP